MSTTDPIRLERRAGQRFEALTPLAVHFEQRLIPGFTQNLSARGIFFYAAVALPEGSLIELTFTMPSEITLGESMPVRCRGRVLRVTSPQINQRNGVAMSICRRATTVPRCNSSEPPGNRPLLPILPADGSFQNLLDLPNKGLAALQWVQPILAIWFLPEPAPNAQSTLASITKVIWLGGRKFVA